MCEHNRGTDRRRNLYACTAKTTASARGTKRKRATPPKQEQGHKDDARCTALKPASALRPALGYGTKGAVATLRIPPSVLNSMIKRMEIRETPLQNLLKPVAHK